MPVVASLVAGDLIDEARDEHPTFDDRRHPGKALRRRLNRYQRELIPEITTRNRSILTDVLEQSLPLADFAAGVVVPDYSYPAVVEIEGPPEAGELKNRTFDIDIVEWAARHGYHMASYLRNNVLYLTGTARDWNGLTTLRFYYVPEVDDLTAPTSTLILPNSARSCLVANLAAFMASRGRTEDPKEQPDKAWFDGQWQRAEQRFFSTMAKNTQVTSSIIREVF